MEEATAGSGASHACVSVELRGGGECEVRHATSGERLRMSRPPEFGGSGGAFSSTDLLAAALGTCIATDLEALAAGHGLAPGEIRIDVEKALAERPKRVEAFHVRIRLPARTDPGLLPRFERAAGACVVRRSLAPGIRVTVDVLRAGAAGA